MSRINKIAGFTLIELMVSVILTAMFLGGVTQVLISTSKNFRTQKSLSYMMEDARFVLEKLNSEFRRAGYISNKLASDAAGNIMGSTFVYDGSTAVDVGGSSYTIRNDGLVTPGGWLTMLPGEVIKGPTFPVGNVSDTVLISYQIDDDAELQAGNQYSPCTQNLGLVGGELPTDSHVISMIFYVAADAGANTDTLYCKAFRENLRNGNTVASGALTLISHVERFRVLFGESDGANGTLYRRADQVVNWAEIVPGDGLGIISVRLSLALRSDESNISAGDPGNFKMNGKLEITPTNIPQHRLYRIFSTTVAIRNSGLLL